MAVATHFRIQISEKFSSLWQCLWEASHDANDHQPVPFLEGIWVEPRSRWRRVGARLIAHIETFLKARGFRELGSDSLIENRVAHDAHAGWGFSETERVVYFRRPL
jgi:GNAT superfamily N-acetyltransferase